jgi:enoyl-CoA hydratase/carnithine racemase
MNPGIHGRLESVLELSAVFQAISHKTADHREAVAAFLDKRAPKFGG